MDYNEPHHNPKSAVALDLVDQDGKLIHHDPRRYNYELPYAPMDYERQLLVKKFCDDRRIYEKDIQEAAWQILNGAKDQFLQTKDLRLRRVLGWQKQILPRLRFRFAVNEKLEFIHGQENFRGRLRRATWKDDAELMAEDASAYTIKRTRKLCADAKLITRYHPMRNVKIGNQQVDQKMAFDDLNPDVALKLLDEAEALAKCKRLYRRKLAAKQKKQAKNRQVILGKNAEKSRVFAHEEAVVQLPNKNLTGSVLVNRGARIISTESVQKNDYVTGGDLVEKNKFSGKEEKPPDSTPAQPATDHPPTLDRTPEVASLPLAPADNKWVVRLADGTEAFVWLESPTVPEELLTAQFPETAIRAIALLQGAGISEWQFNWTTWKHISRKCQYGPPGKRLTLKDLRCWLDATQDGVITGDENPHAGLFVIPEQGVPTDWDALKEGHARPPVMLNYLLKNWDVVLKIVRPRNLAPDLDEAKQVVAQFSAKAQEATISYFIEEIVENVAARNRYEEGKDFGDALLDDFNILFHYGDHGYDIGGMGFDDGDYFFRLCALHKHNLSTDRLLSKKWENFATNFAKGETSTIDVSGLVKHYLTTHPAMFYFMDGKLPLRQWARLTAEEASQLKSKAVEQQIDARRKIAIAKAARV
jgi:hypothetical protein